MIINTWVNKNYMVTLAADRYANAGELCKGYINKYY